jgi:hypothetical protein
MGLRDALVQLLMIWEFLPEMVGPDWPELEQELVGLLARLEEADDEARAELALDILAACQPYPEVSVRLQAYLVRDAERTRYGGGTPEADEAGWPRVLDLSRAVLRSSDVIIPLPGAGPEGSGAEPTGPLPVTDRRIWAWIEERPEGLGDPLRAGEAYTLSFQVGHGLASTTLFPGPEAVVPDAEVPEAGLETEWVVVSRHVELAPLTPDVSVRVAQVDGAEHWTARFSLVIRREVASEIRRLRIVPRPEEPWDLQVVVYAGREVYRELSIRLAAERPAGDGSAATIHGDVQHAPLDHLNLGNVHEWTSPPGELAVAVLGQLAYVKGDVGPGYVDQATRWYGAQGAVAGPIKNLREAAERFRSRWEQYLNDVDADDLIRRLRRPPLQDDWGALPDQADAAHRQRWDEVAASQELRDLAVEGHVLYESFFPAGSELRGWLDRLYPGHRLDISWVRANDPSGWIPHVPWGLMYLPDPPAPGAPVDPMGFLALRFRLGYFAHDAMREGSKALGGPDRAHRAYLLFWGSREGDATGLESRWQREQWSSWTNQVFLPGPTPGAEAKQAVLELLYDPKPAPTTVLYLFCQASVGQGNDPVLRFGDTIQPVDVIGRTELGSTLLADRPLVFANACTTSSGDPYVANELEASFFRRGCRAYLGTETKVPIRIASRFAAIFFHFFYRQITPRPLAAGEAATQARLLLWTAYRNIGGIFYTYVNQYELFMATDEEVSALRA